MAKRLTTDDTREKTEDELADEKQQKAAEKRFGDLQAIVKDAHLLSKEATARLATARMQTTPPDAIAADLDRVLEIVVALKKDCTKAKRLCS